MTRLIAITGGIGSGKSIVSNILRAHNYIVYDCDSEAKKLMDSDVTIQSDLNIHIHPQAVVNGIINRKLIAGIVFSSPNKLQKLNSIVHTAVIKDIKKNALSLTSSSMFIETAILYQSNIDKIIDSVWNVTAPMEIRIKRVMNRNNCSREDVIARINSQDSYRPEKQFHDVKEIVNDDKTPIIPQVLEFLKQEKLTHNL